MLEIVGIISYVIIAYLFGSLCSAIIVCRLFDLPDPRIEGSKNPGATNVLRLAGKKYAAIVLFSDMLKGFIPVFLGLWLGVGSTTLGFICFAVVFGHMYPIFFGFQGGKGVATAIGALFGLNYILGFMVLITWLLVANFFRYSSLASIVCLTFAPFYSVFTFNSMNEFVPIVFVAIFILYKHHKNLTRLFDGNEPKINIKTPKR
jgi:glycerol-3-phosphate acyltransferase PlsY